MHERRCWSTTAFIAGVTIVFGIVALGAVEALIGPALGEGVGRVAGALAFSIGLVFLIVEGDDPASLLGHHPRGERIESRETEWVIDDTRQNGRATMPEEGESAAAAMLVQQWIRCHAPGRCRKRSRPGAMRAPRTPGAGHAGREWAPFAPGTCRGRHLGRYGRPPLWVRDDHG